MWLVTKIRYILGVMGKQKVNDGTFELFYRKGWAYLVVYPPGDKGKPVYFEEIEGRMRMLGVPKVSSKRLRELVEEASGTAVALVEWPEGKYLVSEIEIALSEDEMSASVTVHPPKKGAAPPFPEDVEDALLDFGVKSGIDRGRIEKLLLRKEFGISVPVAEGKEPVHGEAKRVRYHFNTNRGKPYLEMDFGRINLKELNFIENKKEGDLLAELLPPIEPEDGYTVTGRTLPAGNDETNVKLQGGENTRLSEDLERLYAVCDGNAKIERGKVIVEPVVTVENVNYETGNIDFDGSVVVKGSVADGFIVKAKGEIQVGKGTGRARLEAGGNVLLKTGMNGNGSGVIICGGDLFSKYIESSTVDCGGHAFLEEAIMHSDISVKKHCVLNGRRAEIIAGDLVVGGTLWCKKLGTMYEAHTQVDIGIPPDRLGAYREAKKSLETKREELNKTEDQLDRIKTALKEGHTEEKIHTAKTQLSEKVAELTEEVAELAGKLREEREKLHASSSSMVVVEDTMFKGVVIRFGRMEYRAPDNGARKTVLRAGEKEIYETGFNVHDKPDLDFDW